MLQNKLNDTYRFPRDEDLAFIQNGFQPDGAFLCCVKEGSDIDTNLLHMRDYLVRDTTFRAVNPKTDSIHEYLTADLFWWWSPKQSSWYFVPRTEGAKLWLQINAPTIPSSK